MEDTPETVLEKVSKLDEIALISKVLKQDYLILSLFNKLKVSSLSFKQRRLIDHLLISYLWRN